MKTQPWTGNSIQAASDESGRYEAQSLHLWIPFISAIPHRVNPNYEALHSVYTRRMLSSMPICQ